jgi:hypothetical protein
VTTRKQTDTSTYALRSLLAIEALSLLTSIHHLDELGISFLAAAVLIVGLPAILMWWFLRQRNRVARLSYGTLVALIIVVFGLGDGLWNHTVKMTVFFLRGADPANMAGLPFPPSARCSMRSPACSPLWQRSSPHPLGINSSPRPASRRPRRSVSAGCGRDRSRPVMPSSSRTRGASRALRRSAAARLQWPVCRLPTARLRRRAMTCAVAETGPWRPRWIVEPPPLRRAPGGHDPLRQQHHHRAGIQPAGAADLHPSICWK